VLGKPPANSGPWSIDRINNELRGLEWRPNPYLPPFGDPTREPWNFQTVRVPRDALTIHGIAPRRPGIAFGYDSVQLAADLSAYVVDDQ
jgi:hypothetical protein